jgi:hypothetical protein
MACKGEGSSMVRWWLTGGVVVFTVTDDSSSVGEGSEEF